MTNYTYHKEIRTILSQVVNAFDGIILKRFNVNPLIADPIDNVKVKVLYAPKARILNDIVNKSQHLKLPVLSLVMNNLDVEQERQFNKNEGVYQTPDINGKVGPFLQPTPVTFALSTSFLCRYQQDADQYITCLFSNFNPYIILSYKHPEMPDKEVRVTLEWDGNIAYNYPKDLNESTSYRLLLEATFKCKSWIYKNADDLVGTIDTIPVSWTSTDVLSDLYEDMQPLEGPLVTDRMNVLPPTRSVTLYIDVPANGTVTLNFTNNVHNNVEIQWDDGTYEIFNTLGNVKKSHTYTENLIYTVRIKYVVANQITFGSFESGTHVNVMNNTNSDWLKEAILGVFNTKVHSGAFLGCIDLHTVVLGDTITEIEPRAFYQCRSLYRILIPSTVTTIGSMAFYGCVTLKYMLLDDNTVSVGFMAFDGCEKMERVDFSRESTIIQYGMFAKNTNLVNFTIPITVETIEFGAFTQCDSLRTISIPASVTRLAHGAFYWCDNLDIVFLEKSITSVSDITIEEEVFLDCTSLDSIFVPDDSLAIYQAIPSLQPYLSLIKPRSLY